MDNHNHQLYRSQSRDALVEPVPERKLVSQGTLRGDARNGNAERMGLAK